MRFSARGTAEVGSKAHSEEAEKRIPLERTTPVSRSTWGYSLRRSGAIHPSRPLDCRAVCLAVTRLDPEKKPRCIFGREWHAACM